MYSINRLIFILIFGSFSLASFSQLDICGENSSGLFWPIKIGIKKQYDSKNGPYTEYFDGDTIQASANLYYKRVVEYENGEKKTTYFREQDGNVFIYDVGKKIEFLEFSATITPGYTWEKYDKSWKYTVIDTNSTISTPYCNYKNLLNIQAAPQNETKNDYSAYYNLYYKRGIGLVNLTVSGKEYSFLSIDKLQVTDTAEKIFEKVEIEASFPGGDQAWLKYLKKHLNGRVATDNGAPEGQYTVLVQFVVDRYGKITDIKALTHHGYGMEKEVINFLKSCPKWNPALQDGRFVKAYRRQPVTFTVSGE